MRVLTLATLLAAALATAPATAAPPPADEAIFVEGARYDAVLSQASGSWRLLPSSGSAVHLKVAPDCQRGPAPPRGLWLLSRDAWGRPELVAPSATPLPRGHSGHIRLTPCGQAPDARAPALALPAGVLAWLQEHSGAIYVGR
jgi:hypothetical protein